MKNTIIILLALIVVIFSCKREDYFATINKDPFVLFKSQIDTSFKEVINDSIKIGLKYSFSYKVSDEQTPDLIIEKSEGIDAQLNKENQTITVTCNTEGVQKVSLKIKDCYAKVGYADLNLTVFNNLKPNAILELNDTQTHDKYERNISAKNSWDKDMKWGGKVIQYEYKIGTIYSLVTTLDNINYIFDTAGSYLIMVRVKDNSNEWSDWAQTYYNVN